MSKETLYWSQFSSLTDMCHGHTDGSQRCQTKERNVALGTFLGLKQAADLAVTRTFCLVALDCAPYVVCSTELTLESEESGSNPGSGSSYLCDLRHAVYLLGHQHVHLLKMGLIIYSQSYGRKEMKRCTRDLHDTG